MEEFKEKFINPFTDFGFKKIFADEANRDLLLDFLNELLHDEQGQLTDLTYLKSKNLEEDVLREHEVIEVLCKNERGREVICELEKSKQNFFKDRALYYSTVAISEQGVNPHWRYELPPIYSIALLDFVFEHNKDTPHKYLYRIKLKDTDSNATFYDKLTFIYLEMPKFNKSIDELETRLDKWLYILRNLCRMHKMPEQVKDPIFVRLFEAAEITKLSDTQTKAYEYNELHYRDWKSTVENTHEVTMENDLEAGIALCIEQGISINSRGIAKTAFKMGMDLNTVSKLTGISLEDLEEIRRSLPHKK